MFAKATILCTNYILFVFEPDKRCMSLHLLNCWFWIDCHIWFCHTSGLYVFHYFIVLLLIRTEDISIYNNLSNESVWNMTKLMGNICKSFSWLISTTTNPCNSELWEQIFISLMLIITAIRKILPTKHKMFAKFTNDLCLGRRLLPTYTVALGFCLKYTIYPGQNSQWRWFNL